MDVGNKIKNEDTNEKEWMMKDKNKEKKMWIKIIISYFIKVAALLSIKVPKKKNEKEEKNKIK